MDLIPYSYVLLALVVECKANAEYKANTGFEALAVPEAQSRSGLERLDLRKRRHNIINMFNSTYLIVMIITLVIVSSCVVTHCLNSSTSLGSEDKRQQMTERYPPGLRGHGDSQTVVVFPPKTTPRHFHHQKGLCDDANIYICIALKIINTPINRSSSLHQLWVSTTPKREAPSQHHD